MHFIIRRLDQGGGWVLPPGHHHSYTKDRTQAQRYRSYDIADRERCKGNEVVERLDGSPC